MHRSLWAPGSLLVFALNAFVSAASATTLLPLSDHELADRAHVIVIGRATTRQVVWIGQDLTTLVTVVVGESLKGVAGTTLTVALPGGIDRQRKIPIEVLYVGAPYIAAEEEVLLFLEQEGRNARGVYVVSGFSQGKLSIVADPAGVKWVSRSLRHDLKGSAPEAPGLKRLSDFREEIRWHLEGGGP